MNTMTGAELTIRLLERQGIEIIAGIPGGANLPRLCENSVVHIIEGSHTQIQL